MIIVLDDRHKIDLQFLQQHPNVINDFVKLSFEFLRKGANPKLYAGAAKALSVEVSQIQAAIEALAHLFEEGAKVNASENDFFDTVVVLGFHPDVAEILRGFYVEGKAEIRMLQKSSCFDLPHFVNLDWRLDIQVASRTVRSQVEPVFMLKLNTSDGKGEQSQILQADYVNLRHVTEELDLALKELKSAHVRRIMRNIK